jgi:hypothetical protein
MKIPSSASCFIGRFTMEIDQAHEWQSIGSSGGFLVFSILSPPSLCYRQRLYLSFDEIVYAICKHEVAPTMRSIRIKRSKQIDDRRQRKFSRGRHARSVVFPMVFLRAASGWASHRWSHGSAEGFVLPLAGMS